MRTTSQITSVLLTIGAALLPASAAAAAIHRVQPDAGLLAAAHSQSNILQEGLVVGDYEEWFPGVYPGYGWARETTEISSNGLFQLDYVLLDAEKEFQTAIRLNPNLFEAYYFYGRTCFVQERLGEAARLFEQAESVKPEDCQAPSLLAFTCRTMGQTERAQAAYRRTLAKVEAQLELHPDDSRAVYLGATALLELGNQEKGFEWARRSYSLDPGDPYIVYGIACIHSRLGRVEEALDYIEKAIRAGFAHLDWIRNDSDFDALRGHSRFVAILESLRERKRK